MNYIYHNIPKNLKGNIIHPLNKLAQTDKELYDIYVKKYEKREHLLDRMVPYLNIKWNDVVFFSAINPNLLIKAANEVGFDYPEFKYIKVPIEDLDKEKTVIYHYNEINKAKNQDISEYSKLEDVDYQELQEVPDETIKYFKRCFERGYKPKLFVCIPHILLADSIDIEKYL